MGIEIERKFLVHEEKLKASMDCTKNMSTITQAYLSLDVDATVRVRTNEQANKAYLTVKGKNIGIARPEFEYEISYTDALHMISMAKGDVVNKNRYRIKHNEHVWEVDFFFGNNAGLIVAEIELQHEAEPFTKPEWLAEEVSDNPRYYNSNLINNPYLSWSDK